MDNIHHFLNQLDDLPRNLYRLHTLVRGDESSSEDGTSSESDFSIEDSNIPPLYTFDQLNENLVEFREISAGSVSSLEEKQPAYRIGSEKYVPENIVRLAQLIAEIYCTEEQYYEKSGDLDYFTEKLEMELAKLQLADILRTATEFDSLCNTDELNEDLAQVPDFTFHNSDARADPSHFVPETAEHIASALARFITPKYCFICGVKSETGHYDHPKHFASVKKWLEIQVATLKQPVEPELIFCELCNLPLSGNTESEKHYDSKSHVEKSKERSGLKLGHNETVSVTSEENSISGNKQDGLKNENFTKTYACIVKSTHSNDQGTPFVEECNVADVGCVKQEVPVKNYTRLADYILKFIGQPFCYVCNLQAVNHYKSQLHNMNLFKWLQDNKQVMALFDVDNVEDVICFACRTIFYDSRYSESHYKSQKHQRTSVSFCNMCMVHDDLVNHLSHSREVAGKQLKNIKDTVGPIDQGIILSANLRLMCTPIFCDICRMEVNALNPYHYFDRKHILMVRTWLSYGMQNVQVLINPTILFCEACCVILCGTTLAKAHYQLPSHILNQQNYCPACVVRGTPDIMFQHYSTWEHKCGLENWYKLHAAYAVSRHTHPDHDTNNSSQLPSQNVTYLTQTSEVVPTETSRKQLAGQNLSYLPQTTGITVPTETTGEQLLGDNVSHLTQTTSVVPNETPISIPKSEGLEASIAKFMETHMLKRTIPDDEDDLYKQLNEEVATLLKSLYYSEKVSIKQALIQLHRFNMEFIHAKTDTDIVNVQCNKDMKDILLLIKSTSEENFQENSDTELIETSSEVTKSLHSNNITAIKSDMSRKSRVQRENEKSCSIG